jgi:hypothetical protein
MTSILKLQVANFKAPRSPAAGGLTVYEAFEEALNRGWDKVAKEVFSVDPEGTNLVRVVNVDTKYGREMKFYTSGTPAPLNRDADDLPVTGRQLGWDYEWRVHNFRLAAMVEREALELDSIGFVKDLQKDLLTSAKLTFEYMIADHFNTAFGDDGALLLASDGGYYIDSDRPNPIQGAGTWSNLEAPASLAEDTLAAAALNASQMVSPWGTIMPQTIKKLMIPAQYEVQMFRLLNTEKKLGGNDNDINWAASVFKMSDVIVYRWLRIPAIFYWLCDTKSEDNELILRIRKQPEVDGQWGDGKNPDIYVMRVRFSAGLSLGDVRRSIRAGKLV